MLSCLPCGPWVILHLPSRVSRDWSGEDSRLTLHARPSHLLPVRVPSSVFLGAAFLVVLLFWAVGGPAQDTTREIVKKMTVQYPALLENKGMRRNSQVKPCSSSLTAR